MLFFHFQLNVLMLCSDIVSISMLKYCNRASVCPSLHRIKTCRFSWDVFVERCHVGCVRWIILFFWNDQMEIFYFVLGTVWTACANAFVRGWSFGKDLRDLCASSTLSSRKRIYPSVLKRAGSFFFFFFFFFFRKLRFGSRKSLEDETGVQILPSKCSYPLNYK